MTGLHVVVSAVVLASCVIGCGASSSEPRAATQPKPAPVAKESRSEDKSVGFVAAALGASAAEEARMSCRQGMVPIDGKFCIDRYEASLVETMPNGEEQRFSPYTTVASQHVRAVSEPNVYPQGYISRNQAEAACEASGKRLCERDEWQKACRGPDDKAYGYSDTRQPGRCNDKGKNPVVSLFGFRYDSSTMNRSQLNQMDGTLAKTGEHQGCSNGYGVYDMVGNLHEWVSDKKGAFFGGYYQDVASPGHGEGCGYRTTAHEARYHDYSTGFRCCADMMTSSESSPAPSPKASPAKPAKKRGKKH